MVMVFHTFMLLLRSLDQHTILFEHVEHKSNDIPKYNDLFKFRYASNLSLGCHGNEIG